MHAGKNRYTVLRVFANTFWKKRKEYDKSFQLSEKKKSDLFVSMEGIMPESENIT